MLQFTVQIAEEHGIAGKQLFGILAVALGNTLYKLHGGSFDRSVLSNR